MTQLVKLTTRASRDKQSFVYCLDYKDEQGKRKRLSLGHADKRKAERQRAQFERKLRMGIVAPRSLKLTDFLEDSLQRTRGQVRATTIYEYTIAMKRLIESAGDVDVQKITHQHGERFIQYCLDRGNSKATAKKNLKSLKRLFQMAVERGQLDENPFKYIRSPKVPQKKIRVFSETECNDLAQAASDYRRGLSIPWLALTATGLCTAMRRGELLNTVWSDVDFENRTIEVSPKRDTEQTWEWHIKDNERRTLPLTDYVVDLLTEIQAKQPEGYPYVFIPEERYLHIQQRKAKGKWTVTDGKCPVNNFTRHFNAILNKAGIDDGEFHDLRRTCLTGWVRNGLQADEVMRMAGHSDFNTTLRFYLAVDQNLVHRAREITQKSMSLNLAHICHAP
jgi:integrase